MGLAGGRGVSSPRARALYNGFYGGLMRSLLSTIAAAVATLVLSGSAQGQTAEEIVAKNIDAKGGEKLLRSTTSVRTTGTGVMQGQKVAIVTATKRPFQMRNEMTITPPDAPGETRPAQNVVQA